MPAQMPDDFIIKRVQDLPIGGSGYIGPQYIIVDSNRLVHVVLTALVSPTQNPNSVLITNSADGYSITVGTTNSPFATGTVDASMPLAPIIGVTVLSRPVPPPVVAPTALENAKTLESTIFNDPAIPIPVKINLIPFFPQLESCADQPAILQAAWAGIKATYSNAWLDSASISKIEAYGHQFSVPLTP